MNKREDKIKGAIWGLLIGDALGVPYEFHPAENIPQESNIDFIPPAGFSRSHAAIKPGTWSDDGAHALCLLASLLECDRLDPSDLMQKLTAWYNNGYMAVDNVVFDVGIQTSQAISAYRSGTPALECGPNETSDNGNGALMRCLPLALWHQGSHQELIDLAHTQSQITHGHLRSKICCALYCVWAKAILEEKATPWDFAVKTLREYYKEDSLEQAEFEYYIRPDDALEGRGSSYVVDCLRSAWMVNKDNSNYTDTIKAAIRLGSDTDTTACVAGGIAGLKYGLNGIPSTYLSALRGTELFKPLIDKLIRQLFV